MNCQDVDVTSCSKKPLCPCFGRWDGQMFIPEKRVVIEDKALAAWSVGYALFDLSRAVVQGSGKRIVSIFRR